MSTYTYSLSSDFPNGLNPVELKTNIDNNVNITTTLQKINTSGDNIYITFDNTLSDIEQLELNSLISYYQFQPQPNPNLRDRQQIISTDLISTTSRNFIDVDSMSLTTANLIESGNYLINFNAEISMNKNNNNCEFQIVVDDEVVPNSIMSFTQPNSSSELKNTFSISVVVSSISKNIVIKIQCRCNNSSSVLFIKNRRLIIDGVPLSTIVSV